MRRFLFVVPAVAIAAVAFPAAAGERVEVSEDALQRVVVAADESPSGWRRGDEVPYPTTADWTSPLRVQVGGLAVADLNGDGAEDLAVGCYSSSSFPPYDDWQNLIYFNTGSGLEATPSWVSDDERSTGDIRVAL